MRSPNRFLWRCKGKGQLNGHVRNWSEEGHAFLRFRSWNCGFGPTMMPLGNAAGRQPGWVSCCSVFIEGFHFLGSITLHMKSLLVFGRLYFDAMARWPEELAQTLETQKMWIWVYIAQATLLPFFSFMLVVILQVVLWSHVWHEEVIQSFLNWKAGTHWVDIVWQQWGLIGNTNLTFDADKKVRQSDKMVVSSLLCLACCCIECVWLADIAPCCFWILNWRQLAAYVFWLNTRGHYRDLLREMRPGVEYKQARAIWLNIRNALAPAEKWARLMQLTVHFLAGQAKLGAWEFELKAASLETVEFMFNEAMKKRTLKYELNWMWIHRGCVAA